MLTVNEIFHSIQGESTPAGRPCVFVRLTACDLRCSWCDTPYAFTEGRKMSVDDVIERVRSYDCDVVEITGGAPQPRLRGREDDGRRAAAPEGGLPADGAAAGRWRDGDGRDRGAPERRAGS